MQMAICKVTAASFIWVSFPAEARLHAARVKYCFLWHALSGSVFITAAETAETSSSKRSNSGIFILRIISSFGIRDATAPPPAEAHGGAEDTRRCGDDEDNGSCNEEHVGLSASVILLQRSSHASKKKRERSGWMQFVNKLQFVCLYVWLFLLAHICPKRNPTFPLCVPIIPQ